MVIAGYLRNVFRYGDSLFFCSKAMKKEINASNRATYSNF